MTELKARITEIENRLFYLNMKDNWTNKDFELDRRLTKELNELKKEYDNNKERQKSLFYLCERPFGGRKIVSHTNAVCQY